MHVHKHISLADLELLPNFAAVWLYLLPAISMDCRGHIGIRKGGEGFRINVKN